MSFTKNILIKIEQVGQWGTDYVTDFSELKRVRLTNYSLLIAIFSILIFNFFYGLTDFWLLLPIILNIDVFLSVYFIALFVNKKGYHLLAKLLLHSGIFIPVFINTAILAGKEPGNHYYFLLFAVLPVLYLSLKDFRYILFFLFINLASFLYVEFFTVTENMPVLFPENSIFFFRIVTVTLSFLTVAIVIFIYQQQAESNEKILNEQSKNLKDNNTRLLQKTEEIIVQKEQIEKQKNELHRSNITKDKFFSIIAHDLKSPFNALLGFSELLLLGNKEFDADKREEMIKAIYNTANQTLSLLNNLLIWSKIETGEVHFNPQKIKINTIIEETVSLLKNIASKKSIEINCELEKGLVVYADKDMIATVIRNLISNAIKFSYKNSSIIVTLKKVSEDVVRISISDKGVGIDNKKLESVFNVENIYSEKGTEGEKGTGLGLKLCKEFVEKNKGKIWVESKKDEGSVFSFTIPIASV